MATKKRNLKIAKAYIKQNNKISAEEKYKDYEAAYACVEREYKKSVKVSKLANTKMDDAIKKNKEMEQFGKQDLSIFLPKENKNFYYWNTEKYLDEPEGELFLFETDKILKEERTEQIAKNIGVL